MSSWLSASCSYCVFWTWFLSAIWSRPCQLQCSAASSTCMLIALRNDSYRGILELHSSGRAAFSRACGPPGTSFFSFRSFRAYRLRALIHTLFGVDWLKTRIWIVLAGNWKIHHIVGWPLGGRPLFGSFGGALNRLRGRRAAREYTWMFDIEGTDFGYSSPRIPLLLSGATVWNE